MRTQIPMPTRKQVRIRDNNACRKCGRKTGLHTHHIKAAANGGDNSLDNLILLCLTCHQEWHIAESIEGITIDQWLPLPTLHALIRILLRTDWPDNMSAKEMRYRMLQIHALFKDGILEADDPNEVA